MAHSMRAMSGEPANFSLEYAARWRAGRPRRQSREGQRPTLGDLQRATPWVWLYCERCPHHASLACAVAVIRWGPDASSDRLRQWTRCTACGSNARPSSAPAGQAGTSGFSRSLRELAAAREARLA